MPIGVRIGSLFQPFSAPNTTETGVHLAQFGGFRRCDGSRTTCFAPFTYEISVFLRTSALNPLSERYHATFLRGTLNSGAGCSAGAFPPPDVARSRPAVHVSGPTLPAEAAPSSAAGVQRLAESALRSLPRVRPEKVATAVFRSQFVEHAREHRRDRCHLFGIRISRNDDDLWLEFCCRFVDHSGMFPCFFGGWLARLVRRARSALTTATRVAAGSMIPSSSPRSAARNGDATL